MTPLLPKITFDIAYENCSSCGKFKVQGPSYCFKWLNSDPDSLIFSCFLYATGLPQNPLEFRGTATKKEGLKLFQIDQEKPILNLKEGSFVLLFNTNPIQVQKHHHECPKKRS